MAIEKDNIISASDFLELKQKIDNECRRRQYIGSVANVPDQPEYKYTNNPESDKVINLEHYQKIVNEIQEIHDLSDGDLPNYKLVNSNALIELWSDINNLEKINKSAGSGETGCRSSCTGLCSTTCSGTCKSGCSGSCGQNCGGYCYTNVCKGQCGTSCMMACSNQCLGTCTTGCIELCDGTCGNTCFMFGCVSMCEDMAAID